MAVLPREAISLFFNFSGEVECWIWKTVYFFLVSRTMKAVCMDMYDGRNEKRTDFGGICGAAAGCGFGLTSEAR